MVCIVKVKAIRSSLPALFSTKYPSGKKVISAISFAISIDARYVIATSAAIAERVV
jgi:hypothetical protein